MTLRLVRVVCGVREVSEGRFSPKLGPRAVANVFGARDEVKRNQKSPVGQF